MPDVWGGCNRYPQHRPQVSRADVGQYLSCWQDTGVPVFMYCIPVSFCASDVCGVLVSWCVCVCVCVCYCVCVCVCVSHRCLSSTATQYRWTTNRAAPAYSVWRIWCTRWTLVSLLEEGSTARQETTLPTDNSTIPKLMYSRRGIANMANVAQLTDSPWST